MASSSRPSPLEVEAPAPKPVRGLSAADAYDVAELAPATQGLWPMPEAPAAQPLVSIVILSLNGAEMLDRLLRSFQAVNSYPHVEILVVDHGSTDGSLALLRGWADRLPVKILARGANYSFSASNNRAARLAAGELLLLLNNDTVFTEDVLPDMVRLLSDEKVGAVGLKQHQPAETPSGRRVYHLGVRFGWNVVERRLRPSHVRPNPIDAAAIRSAASYPAVTASILLCRRAEFLGLGGFSEDYVYGLEDVDFCCRLRWRLGKAVVSLNSRSALHYKNSTRDRDAESRRPQEKANRRVLQARCGYALRREFLSRRVDDDGAFTGSRFTAGFAVDADSVLEAEAACPGPVALADALRRLYDWDVRILPRRSWTEAKDLDLYVAASPLVRASALSDIQPHLVTAAIADADEEAPSAWTLQWDLAIRPGAGEGWDSRARDLHDLVASRLRAFRISIKAAAGSDRTAALAEAVQRLGAPARVDLEADWYGPRSIADDVAVILPDAAAYRPSVDQINLRIAASDDAEGEADVVLSGGHDLPERLAERILDAVRPLHEVRARGPDDPPLRAAARETPANSAEPPVGAA